MRWSLSEFLNLFEMRGKTWCFVNLGDSSGVSIAHSEAIFFHGVLEGTCKLSWTHGPAVDLKAGDVVLLTAGDSHTIRTSGASQTASLDPINSVDHFDEPPHVAIGAGQVHARLMSGKLKVWWPGGKFPSRMPSMLMVNAASCGIDLAAFMPATRGPGATALMTRLAATFFTAAFRDEPRCRALFQWELSDPIARAKLVIEKHPFQPWTVASLASKVGMGRSNFAGRFLAQIGVTPIDALTRERMIAADRLLLETDLKVAEISARVGYRSEAAFIRRFTAHFGNTPGHRRRSRSDERSVTLVENLGQSFGEPAEMSCGRGGIEHG